MTHTDSQELTRLLVEVASQADTLRAVFAKVEVPNEEPGGAPNRRVASDQAKALPEFKFRYRLLHGVSTAIEGIEQRMAVSADSWMAENQARADKGLPPTNDVVELYKAMTVFATATRTAVDGAASLFQKSRAKVALWMERAAGWFPALNPTPPDHMEQEAPAMASTIAVPSFNRDSFANIFKQNFKDLSGFLDVLADRAKELTPTDWGRLFYQLQNCNHVLPSYKRMKPFKKWFETFGIVVPKDPSPGRYADYKKGSNADFSPWLT